MKRTLTLLLTFTAALHALAADDGFRPLFNGKDLAGWDGNPELWSVEDGCITGRTTGPGALAYNQFLIWRGGTVKNFELRATIKQSGNNTGIQYRSGELPEIGRWSVGGYQCDIHPVAKNNAMVYHEKGRGIITLNGQSVVIDPGGKRHVVAQREPVKVDVAEWNEYTVIARGNHLIHKINGQVTVDLVDHEEAARALGGLLAFQIHKGPAMSVQIKNVMLKELPEGGVIAFDPAALPATPEVPEKAAPAPGKKAKNAGPSASAKPVRDAGTPSPAWKWLWNDVPDAGRAARLRKEFDLGDAAVTGAVLRAACDNGAKVFLNGKLVLTNPDWQKPSTEDVRSALRAGKNELRVEATNSGSKAGFVGALTLRMADGSTRVIPSDASWQAAPPGGGEWRTARVIAAYGDKPWGGVFGTVAPALPGAKPEQAAKTVRPGSPGTPANLRVAPGFVVETVYEVPSATQGSWVSLALDGRGRLLASDQGGRGFFRITPGADAASTRVEKVPVNLSGAQGMGWHGNDLYFFASGEGLFRVSDTDGDDQLDRARLLTPLSGNGEHGTHAVLDAEDGKHLYVVAGNQTPLPPAEHRSGSRVPSWGDDLLLPRQWDAKGHARGIPAPGGWITRFDPAAEKHEVFCVGFRNEYDAALNAHGDLFTYDADMEWDLGLPWYRPTRICHVVSGGDFGWRSGSGKWPAYHEDTLPPLVEIGPGSPTGVVSGRGAKFPARYQHAVFALDWTYGRILAIHATPEGAGYRGESETFIAGAPLPVTDAVVAPDGHLYFTIGGRGTRSALLRVRYTGGDSTAPAPPAPLPEAAKTRRALEAFHGRRHPGAVETAWPHLASGDRFLRHAARIAVESQPAAEWAGKVFHEPDAQARIAAAVALARSGRPEHRAPLVKALLELEFAKLPVMQKLGVLRGLSLAFDRLGKPDDGQRGAVAAKLAPHFPSADADLNTELLKLLVYLGAPGAVPEGVALLADAGGEKVPDWAELKSLNARYGGTLERMAKNPPPSRRIGYAFTLRTAAAGWTPELRRAYFAFLNEAGAASGGSSYPGYLANIREEALTLCTDAERLALKDIIGRDFNPVPDFPITPPMGPGREWTMSEAVAATGSKALKQADWASGRNLFHAVGCGVCHRFNGLGGGAGPDLTSVPNKFDTAYLLEAILEPSKVISDQYGSSVVTLKDGRTLTGLVVEQDEKAIRVYPADLKAPGDLVQRAEVKSIGPSPISQMPQGLVNSLNEKELRELVAYIMSGGNPRKK